MKVSVAAFLFALGIIFGFSCGPAHAGTIGTPIEDCSDCPPRKWTSFECNNTNENQTEPEFIYGSDCNEDYYARVDICNSMNCDGSSGGGDEGGGLTQEQLDALEAVIAALQAIQEYSGDAAGKLALLNSLNDSLTQLQTSLNDYQGQVSGALATIGEALAKISGYLQQGEALGPQALAMIEQQVVIAVVQRSIAGQLNMDTQGCTVGDPVLVANGFETYKTEDLSYRGLHDLITISRQFRSNSTDLNSSFGRSWFFNYDTNVVAGRKPLIKEREELTADLEAEARRLAGLAAAEMHTALSALDTARNAAAQAQALATQIAGVNSQIHSLSSEISTLNSLAASEAATASQKAAIAGTSDAQGQASSAQSLADATAGYASQASSTATSSAGVANNAAQSASAAVNDLNQAETSVAAIIEKEHSIRNILDERIADAAEAAAEARLEEEMYPLDPYPSDPTVYFGPGYVKVFTEEGTPILYQEQEGDDGHYLPVSDNGSYTDEIIAMENGFALIDKNRNSREFLHNGKGIYLFSRAVDTNNNITQFIRVEDRLTEIIDPVGRKTTIGYNAEGYINLITDPQGNTHSYTYEEGKLVTHTDPMGYDWSYSYDDQARMTARIDPQGNSHRYLYDDQDRVVRETDKEDFQFLYSYDPENRVTQVTDRRGLVTNYIYNENNRLQRVLYPDGSEVSYAYDGRNNVVAVSNENGEVTYFTYNDNNDITSTTNPLGEKTEITYEATFKKVASVTDPLGQTRFFDYDSKGNLITIIHPDNSVRTLGYTSQGLVESVTDENGNTTALTYNGLGQLTDITFPDGSIRSQSQDIIGRILSVTDELGNSSSFTYNALGSLVKKVDPLGAETGFVYDELQRKLQVVDALGNITSYSYSRRGDLLTETDQLGNVLGYEYDGEGNRVATIYPNGTGIEFGYDARSRLVEKRTFPGDRVTVFAYDLKGQKTAEQDANGNITRYHYDAAGRVVAKIDAKGNATTTSYDTAGNLLQVIDPNGNPISYLYDSLNRMVKTTNALGNATSYSYDGVGNLVSKQRPDGSLIQYSYDARNRLISTLYPDGSTKSYAYDQAGRMVNLASQDTEETRSYDAVGRLLTADDAYTGRIEYSYDLLGNRTSITDPAKGVMNYEYDAKNRVVAFTDPEGGRSDFTFDTMGRVVGVTHPNDTQTVQVWNNDNRLESITTTGEMEGTLTSFSYTYDAVGNKLSVVNEDGELTGYTYDELNQLVYVDYPVRDWEPILTDEEIKNGGTLMGKGNKNGHFKDKCDSDTCLPSAVSYVYDPAGNRISHTDDWQTVNYSYNAANQMLTAGVAAFTYDENGNRIRKVDAGEVAIYSYTYDDLLDQVDSPNGESTAYGYDALNRRVYKVNQDGDTTTYLYDGLEVLQEITGQVDQKIATYYRTNGRILTRQEFNVSQDNVVQYQNRPDGRQLYYSYDGLGSVASIANHQGRIQSKYRYDAYGVIVDGDITENTYTFTGKRFDEETGVYHFHFRQYDPVTGVWSSSDPIGVLGGVNLYQYVKGNPIVYVDPLGLVNLGNIGQGSAAIVVGSIAVFAGAGGSTTGCGAAIGVPVAISGAATVKWGVTQVVVGILEDDNVTVPQGSTTYLLTLALTNDLEQADKNNAIADIMLAGISLTHALTSTIDNTVDLLKEGAIYASSVFSSIVNGDNLFGRDSKNEQEEVEDTSGWTDTNGEWAGL